MKPEMPPVGRYESVRIVFEGAGPIRVLSTEVRYTSDQGNAGELRTGPETWKLLTPSRLALLYLLVRHRGLLAEHPEGIDPEQELLRGPRPSLASRLKDNLFDKGRQWLRESFGTLGGMRGDTPGLVRLYRMTEEGGQHVVRLLSDGRFSLAPDNLVVIWNEKTCTNRSELNLLEQLIERQAGAEDGIEERNGAEEPRQFAADDSVAGPSPAEAPMPGRSATDAAAIALPSPGVRTSSLGTTRSSGMEHEEFSNRSPRRRWLRHMGVAATGLAAAGLAFQGFRGRPTGVAAIEAGAVVIDAKSTPGDASSVFRIGSPGVYRVIAPLRGEPKKVGILVHADDVTLDLGGQTITGGPGSLSGIAGAPGSLRRLTIRNGTVSGWGKTGVDLPDAQEVTVADVTLAGNGAGGLVLGGSSRVSRCRASGNVGNGIHVAGEGVVEDCDARENAEGIRTGVGSRVRNSQASFNHMDGIVVEGNSLVEGCLAHGNFGSGFQMAFGSLTHSTATGNGMNGFNCERTRVEGCTAQLNKMDGFRGSYGCTFAGNSSRENAKAGIQVLAGLNWIQNNHVVENARGIEVTQGPDSRGNVVSGNVVMMNRDDDVDVDTPQNNAIGQTVTIEQEKATPLDAPAWSNIRWEPTAKKAP